MRNLISRLGPARRRCRDENGAIAVIVAILLGSGVLLGMGALVIDVGEFYNERALLTNAAQEAAVAIAKSCVTGSCATIPAVGDVQAAIKGPGSISIGTICGSGTLGACPAAAAGTVSCPPAASGVGYVDVYASTPLTGRSALLPAAFPATLPGLHAFAGKNMSVCVQASWGAPAAAQATAITISQCSWQSATGFSSQANAGTSGGGSPGIVHAYSTPSPSSDVAFQLLSFGGGGGCSSGQPVFGWAADSSGYCSLPVSGPRYPGWSGIPPPSCLAALASAQSSHIPVVIPIFSSVWRRFGVRTYRLYGFADFVVTGYHFAGTSAPDWLNPANTCTGSLSCVNGYFTEGVVPTTGSFGGPYLGATIIDLTN
jgi:hypothetical protein